MLNGGLLPALMTLTPSAGLESVQRRADGPVGGVPGQAAGPDGVELGQRGLDAGADDGGVQGQDADAVAEPGAAHALAGEGTQCVDGGCCRRRDDASDAAWQLGLPIVPCSRAIETASASEIGRGFRSGKLTVAGVPSIPMTGSTTVLPDSSKGLASRCFCNDRVPTPR